MDATDKQTSETNPTLPHSRTESAWRTYLRGIVFALPAVVAWAFACAFLIPKARDICHGFAWDNYGVQWPWQSLLFLLALGRSILVALFVILGLLELTGKGWAQRRRIAVGFASWLVNFLVLYGLTMVIIVILVAAPHTLRGK